MQSPKPVLDFDIAKLYNSAEKHIAEHQCSAHPYKHGAELLRIIAENNSKQVLEIGTGIGYTAVIMTLANPHLKLDTMEKDITHAKVAKKYFKDKKVADRISVINDFAETTLPMMQKLYDLIFFDGFQIHYEFLPQYKRLLKHGGILFLANNHLKSKTSDRFFKELNDPKDWEILEQFDDTTIARRK